MITTTGWIKLCARVSQKNLIDLGTVMSVAQKLDPMAADEAMDPALRDLHSTYTASYAGPAAITCGQPNSDGFVMVDSGTSGSRKW